MESCEALRGQRRCRPVARELEHANEYPELLVEKMKAMGIFGLCIPEPYGDFAVSTPCFACDRRDLAAAWMSLAGIFGGHAGGEHTAPSVSEPNAQKSALLCARLATGEVSAAPWHSPSLAEARDLQALRTFCASRR